MQSRLTSALLQWPMHAPRRALAACAFVILALLGGMAQLTTTNDYKAFFGPDNPDLLAHEAFEHTFELRETLIFGIEAVNADGTPASFFTPARLQALADLTAEAWRFPYALRVQSPANYQHTRADGDDIIVEPLIPDDAAGLDDDAVAQIRRIALAADDVIGRQLSADGRVAALLISTALPDDGGHAVVNEVAAAAYALVDQINAHPAGLRGHVTGVTLLSHTLGETMTRDIKVLAPAALLIVLVGMLVVFRSLVPAALTLGVIGLSVGAGLGAGGWLGIVLTDVSMASMLCIMTLAVADCVHLFVTYFAARADLNTARDDHRAALREALRVNLGPVFVTSLTTAIGFLALNASESPPFRDLGNMVAIGVLMAFVLSVVALPAAMMLIPPRWLGTAERAPRGQAQVEALGGWITRHHRLLLPISAAVLLVCCAGLALNRFGENYVEYFPPDNRFRAATQFVNDELSGMQVIEYAVDSGTPGGVQSPAVLAALDALRAWFEQQPETRDVISPTALFKRLNRTMHGDDPAWYRIPESQDLAAQYLLFFELSLPQGLTLNNLIAADRQTARMTVLLDAVDTDRIQALARRAEAWMAAELPPGMTATATGPTLMFARVSQRNFRAMAGGVAAAVVLIALILMRVFRSVRLGLLSMIPNLLPGLAAYGLWGLTVGKLDMALSVVGSLSLGILVDDTVHFLSKYQRARRELGQSPEQAVQTAFNTVGMALITTTAILVAGFALFTQSDFSMVQHLGALTAVAVALALFCDFLLLPGLLIRATRNQHAALTTGRWSGRR